jgi:hypothetical protein
VCRHVEWLIRHPAAGDIADEIQDLTRTAATLLIQTASDEYTSAAVPTVTAMVTW